MHDVARPNEVQRRARLASTAILVFGLAGLVLGAGAVFMSVPTVLFALVAPDEVSGMSLLVITAACRIVLGFALLGLSLAMLMAQAPLARFARGDRAALQSALDGLPKLFFGQAAIGVLVALTDLAVWVPMVMEMAGAAS